MTSRQDKLDALKNKLLNKKSVLHGAVNTEQSAASQRKLKKLEMEIEKLKRTVEEHENQAAEYELLIEELQNKEEMLENIIIETQTNAENTDVQNKEAINALQNLNEQLNEALQKKLEKLKLSEDMVVSLVKKEKTTQDEICDFKRQILNLKTSLKEEEEKNSQSTKKMQDFQADENNSEKQNKKLIQQYEEKLERQRQIHVGKFNDLQQKLNNSKEKYNSLVQSIPSLRDEPDALTDSIQIQIVEAKVQEYKPLQRESENQKLKKTLAGKENQLIANERRIAEYKSKIRGYECLLQDKPPSLSERMWNYFLNMQLEDKVKFFIMYGIVVLLLLYVSLSSC